MKLYGSQDFRGHLVISEGFTKTFLRTKEELLNQLSKNHKVPEQQLNFFMLRLKAVGA